MHNEKKNWQELKQQFYGKNSVVLRGHGVIFFATDSLLEVVGGEKLEYDEYLEIQRLSVEESGYRSYFDLCYSDAMGCEFAGQITRKTDKHVLFNRVYINGSYWDGSGFEGREHHVWMDAEPFSDYDVGTCLNFSAEVYRYLKVGNGKRISLGLRNPTDIVILNQYEIPTDEDLLLQQFSNLACEVCLFYEHCNGTFCLAADNYHKDMVEYLKTVENGKFTPLTIMAAYEKAGLVVTQMVENKMLSLPDDINDPISKIVFDSWLHPAARRMDLDYALSKMFYPEKRRMYLD